ncbi:TIGR03619 family F420-dependent LLM class oxidoreductase [Streptomyces gilvus]|uniref:TIGR03619 family F420-dependent LLM class oxidoreductase n=1 Tax=Streptomyces gilvus TaxID=2920937 RepID=UPI001F0FAB1C|nr:TIGR03619 family F420-dependent LLM class oxidoreductase [Streptomyces sp. CME 23]MCH5675645.1 TIGR03619 family F420-dependent LLM class oxidoreductase [Streptomyces sp. CME 23]
MPTRTPGLTVGITIPFFDHQSDYETILGVARRSEECGYDSVWMADHLSRPSPQGGSRWFDVVTLLSNIAAHCGRIGIGTDVLVVPYRHPVLAAKMLATLDVVSGGRLTVGTGVGYIEDEFTDLGAPFAERGPFTTECIQIWKKIWAGGEISHRGKFFSFDNLASEHVPARRPGPPVWIGGTADAVLRRVVEVGDGWHPIYLPFDVLEAKTRRLHELAERAGREQPISLSYSGGFGSVGTASADPATRAPLTGTVDDVLRDVERLRRLGFTNIVFRFGAPDASNDHVLRQIELVAERILPALRA